MKTITFLKKQIIMLGCLLLIVSCSKNEEEQTANPNKENLVSQTITAQGGTINAPDAIQIVFPQNGVTANVDVVAGYTGTEPTNFGNTNFNSVVKPFTIKMDYSKLKDSGMKIIINAPLNFDSNKSIAICSANPLLPLKFDFNSITNKIEIFFDKADNGDFNLLDFYSSYVFTVVVNGQFANQDEFGFKQVSLNNNIVALNTLGTIGSNEKILLLVHGWRDAPSDCWSSFIKKIIPQITSSNYNKVITFGYYSGLAINTNGQLLGSFLNSLPATTKVDIVAHSMGGLVTRSAIENHNASARVKNLITLGTPHKGSLGGYAKNAVGFHLKFFYDSNSSLIGNFNNGSQGFDDLKNTSAFITNLNNNAIPSTVNYYPIAAVYTQNQDYANLAGITISTLNQQPMVNGIVQSILIGSDGIVARSSALGIQGNNNLSVGATFEIFAALPHSKMTDDNAVIAHVATKLNSYNTQLIIPSNGLIAYYPFNGNTNDESGNNIDGSVIGNLQLSSDRKGNLNQSYNFDGNYNNYIKIPSTSINNLQNLSICAWVKPLQNGGFIVSAGRDITSGSFRLVNSNFATQVNYNGINGCGATAALPLNQWAFIVGTLNGLQSKYYLNGQLVDSVTISSLFNTNISCHSLVIGRHSTYCSQDNSFPYPFSGSIDDIRIYNRELSQSEILMLYND